ncbi:MAG: hypothetical protein LBD99_01610 [Candidatus Margulisbacteria bacterium]|jgi:cell fate regulator YaaT (PSP1 superfamily)|nr:hypothetical protein [Candidatus Margulisiibacteriota bacterium]
MASGKFALHLRKHNSAVPFELRLAPFFVKHGDALIVETNRGEEIAVVARLPAGGDRRGLHEDIRVLHILRQATPEDQKSARAVPADEQDLFRRANEIVAQNMPEIKLISAELLFSRKKAYFFYRLAGAENEKKKKNQPQRKTNAREIQRLLHQELGLQAEARELASRSCAYAIGGLGHCGCGLCCTTWLRKPAQISVKMAKEQNLAINIPKLSGVCGKLMCCLDYELPKKDLFLETVLKK